MLLNQRKILRIDAHNVEKCSQNKNLPLTLIAAENLCFNKDTIMSFTARPTV